jgi:hypothetical protein
VAQYQGENPLYAHGPIRVAEDHHHFEYADGTPFFWLGDTWWGGLVKRFRWPEDFQELALDRATKGFSVIQICAAFPPIMDPFDPRAECDGGYPWDPGFTTMRPEYFDMADLRIRYLVDQGLVPCVFGGWGFNLLTMGVEKTKSHWRYLIARWGAYPVVWSLAGEGDLPWYLNDKKEEEAQRLREGWSQVARYVRATDPYRRPLTTHPHPSFSKATAREAISDDTLLDFDMLQTGHFMCDLTDLRGAGTIPFVVDTIRKAAGNTKPKMPVLNGEPTYEGVFGAGAADYQRFQFWYNILSGASAGFTYGAAGIWEFNTEDVQAGLAPNGINWGTTPWNVAYKHPGSAQVGRFRKLLLHYQWWLMEPHQEWLEPHWDGEYVPRPFAGGIPGRLRIVYWPPMRKPPLVKQLEQGVTYRGLLCDPITGAEHDLGSVKGDAEGDFQPPVPPIMQDWLLILEVKE